MADTDLTDEELDECRRAEAAALAARPGLSEEEREALTAFLAEARERIEHGKAYEMYGYRIDPTVIARWETTAGVIDRLLSPAPAAIDTVLSGGAVPDLGARLLDDMHDEDGCAPAVRAVDERPAPDEAFVQEWARKFAAIEQRPDLDYEWAGHIRALLAAASHTPSPPAAPSEADLQLIERLCGLVALADASSGPAAQTADEFVEECAKVLATRSGETWEHLNGEEQSHWMSRIYEAVQDLRVDSQTDGLFLGRNCKGCGDMRYVLVEGPEDNDEKECPDCYPHSYDEVNAAYAAGREDEQKDAAERATPSGPAAGGAAPPVVTMVAKREGGWWVATCADFCLATQAQTMPDLQAECARIVAAHFASCAELGVDPMAVPPTRILDEPMTVAGGAVTVGQGTIDELAQRLALWRNREPGLSMDPEYVVRSIMEAAGAVLPIPAGGDS